MGEEDGLRKLEHPQISGDGNVFSSSINLDAKGRTLVYNYDASSNKWVKQFNTDYMMGKNANDRYGVNVLSSDGSTMFAGTHAS